MSDQTECAVIGGGPAGLMAAEVLSDFGYRVVIYDQMPSLGRKFLMAGVGGLNLTHSEPMEGFLGRYRGSVSIHPTIKDFSPDDLRKWCEALGQETFVGSSGRVFPTAMKASPLLRGWLKRLGVKGVTIRTRHRWTGWNGTVLNFETPDGPATVSADITVLALGGASWTRLGSDGKWLGDLQADDIETTSFKPSNCGFSTGWQRFVGERYAGQPLKAVSLTFDQQTVRGEAMITSDGIEGGAVYALSPVLRDTIARQGGAVLTCDLKPEMTIAALKGKLSRYRAGDSISNRLRKLRLTPASIAVLREGVGPLSDQCDELAYSIKNVPIRLSGTSSIDRAISTAGGVLNESLDPSMMIRKRPGTFVAGEMLDWEAPTGGYLLQACFASGRWAAKGAIKWRQSSRC